MKPLAYNPYLPAWEYVPDGEPHVFDGRVYVYGSHDAPGGKTYCPGHYVCWSAPVDSLGEWRFEGVIFRREDDPSNADGSGMLFAPDVCRGPDGRYYLYYALASSQAIGVAVCDAPAGHFRFLGNVRMPDGSELSPESGYGMTFDPAVYVEGEYVWLYYGFGVAFHSSDRHDLGGYTARLEPDMVTLAEPPQLIVPGPELSKGTPWEAHPFFEASSMRKLNGKYYFVYSSLQGHELCCGTGDRPDGPFTFGGVIVSNGDVGLPGHETEAQAVNYMGNNHGGLIQAGEQVYIFYHRHTHGTQYSRQGCAEPVVILPDGSIPQVEVTSCGLNGGPLPARGEYSAHIACALRGPEGPKRFSSKIKRSESDPAITQEPDASPTAANLFIANLRQGAVCGFKYFAFTGEERVLGLELRGTLAGTVTVRLDSEDGPAAAQAAAAPSERWQYVEAPLEVPAGKHAVYLTFRGEGACDLNAIAFA
ncbi:MAG: family 43 glycosylhydrolase [Oscillospiraceae bacterium]|nr:family 43 glycosylhydrolase [Oscillospiraceae bacterium]